MSVQVPHGKPPAISSSSPFMPLGVRSIASSLMRPFLDGVKANAAKLVQLFFVKNHLLTAIAGQLEVLGQEDGLLWTDIFAKAAVDASQHIDIEGDRIFLDVTAVEFSPNDGNGLRWADLLAKKAGHALFSAVLVRDQGRGPSVVGGKFPALLGVFHGHLRSEQVTKRQLKAAEDFRNIQPLGQREVFLLISHHPRLSLRDV